MMYDAPPANGDRGNRDSVNEVSTNGDLAETEVPTRAAGEPFGGLANRQVGGRAIARPGLTERALIILMILINMFGTPASWFTLNTGSASGPESDFLLSYGSLAIVLALLPGLVGNGDAVVRVLSAEPLMVAYFFMIGLSPVWSSSFGESVASVVNVFALLLLAVVLLVRFTPEEIFGLTTVAFTIGIVLDLFWVFFMGSLGVDRAGDAWVGVATQKNALGHHGLLAVMVFLIAARTFRRWRVPFYVLTVASFVLLIGSQSKTSLGAGLVTAAGFVVFLTFRARKTLAGAVTITLISGIVITILFVTANLEEIAGRFGKDATFTGRTPLWSAVLDAIAEKPWLGYGYDGYFGGPLSESHLITAYAQFDWGPTHAHNALFESALHVGIPATILLLVFMFRGIVRATNHVRWVRGPIGLFPLVYLTMITMTSITESGIFTQRFGVTMFVIAIVMAKVGVQEAKKTGVLRLDEERLLAREASSERTQQLPRGLAPAGV
ncbi:MAG: O-antigen ligase family protein [Actinomycetota bacterium]